jgi:hypothetical protein
LNGRALRWRKFSTAVRTCSQVSIAQGIEPNPPAADTARASSQSDEPAIGACMIGISIPSIPVSFDLMFIVDE